MGENMGLGYIKGMVPWLAVYQEKDPVPILRVETISSACLLPQTPSWTVSPLSK